MNVEYFCPRCWSRLPADLRCCPACHANLSMLDHESYDEHLVRALWHPIAERATLAATILGQRGNGSAVGPLLHRYQEGADPYLVAAIARALIAIGTPKAHAALRLLERERSVIIRRAIEDARL